MPSHESSRAEYQPDEHSETSGLRPTPTPIPPVDPQIMQKALEIGDNPTPIHERAVMVEQVDGNRTLVYRTMGRVHSIPDLTEDQALKDAENARQVAEAFDRN